jgi:predicted glycogen debranching enzyme
MEARNVLVNFGRLCTGGLVPNFLSDLSLQPSCNTVDASLWYVNSVLQYLKYTGDFDFVRLQLWEILKDIMESHISGTDYGIHVDKDGLLAHGPRLTWMDAEANGKAVTPREGKAVEIQALWYNALKTVQLIAMRFGEPNLADYYAELSEKARAAFNAKFWNDKRNCLFDVLEESGADTSLRPNQTIAGSLDFPILNTDRIAMVVDTLKLELLTPCGLRTLERDDQRYKPRYVGGRIGRDEAYHNGTVWPWLLGPFISAFLRAKGYSLESRNFAGENIIEPFFAMQIAEAGLGTVSEIFDGDPPHTPRGCISQAWSIAEPLRAYVEGVLGIGPKFEKEVLGPIVK